MFPPEGQPLSVRPDDALLELRRAQTAGQIIADAFRQLAGEMTDLLGDIGELQRAAVHGSTSGYAMVPQHLVRKPIVRALQYYRGIGK